MSTTQIATLPGESTDLALHTKMCEMRYNQILTKFSEVETTLDTIRQTLEEIQHTLQTDKTAVYRTYLGWAGVLITALIGILSHFVMKI